MNLKVEYLCAKIEGLDKTDEYKCLMVEKEKLLSNKEYIDICNKIKLKDNNYLELKAIKLEMETDLFKYENEINNAIKKICSLYKIMIEE